MERGGRQAGRDRARSSEKRLLWREEKKLTIFTIAKTKMSILQNEKSCFETFFLIQCLITLEKLSEALLLPVWKAVDCHLSRDGFSGEAFNE